MGNPATRASAQAACATALALMPDRQRAALIVQNGPVANMAIATCKRIIWPKR